MVPDAPLIVLTVVREPADRGRLSRLAPENGINIHWVTSLAAAIAALAERDHDAIVIDGYFANERSLARLLEEDPLARIIVLGDHGGERELAAARAAGAADVISVGELNAATLRRALTAAADHRRAVASVRHAALHDPLTGLPNRTLATDRLRHALRRRRRRNAAVAVLYLDLDGFKQINDTFGHAAGDALLRATGARILATVRPADTVARFGGDEFVVLLEDISDAGAAADVAERVIAELSVPLSYEGEELRVTASVGVALGGVGDEPDGLLRDADSALYRAKAAGRGRHALDEERMRPAVGGHRARTGAPRRALTSGVRA